MTSQTHSQLWPRRQ